MRVTISYANGLHVARRANPHASREATDGPRKQCLRCSHPWVASLTETVRSRSEKIMRAHRFGFLGRAAWLVHAPEVVRLEPALPSSVFAMAET